MKIDGRPQRTIWVEPDSWSVGIIDQTRLPHHFVTTILRSVEDAVRAIADMQVRGAPLIGVTAAYGLSLALRDDASDASLAAASARIAAARPTAINLKWALERMARVLDPRGIADRAARAYSEAAAIAEEDVAINEAIGRHGIALIERAAAKRAGRPVNILTHCNAGWLATVDWGTATAPIYLAHDRGIPVHVWVDETRPRNQGASLTAWELGRHGVAHTVIADNTGGHLMQRGLVDLCLVGTDRTTAAGDVANKIGTYLKALAAFDNGVPFYVAAPSPSIDWSIASGADIPIEQRAASEVSEIAGLDGAGNIVSVTLTPPGTSVANYAFDVTPARLVTALITERGVAPATRDGLAALFPDHGLAKQRRRE